ncbi:hypothetical protein BTN50_0789 [Candidatus Enterovibrio altilux]|uniref:Uncharacterized protein n=1 Tax=Candidatus Enterovibrio altilux TaxID=1927128 RepID=A0A291B8H8_9GAMM|nr:hypothetical protein BTN50_0789 [Candidatus Enterovibrio luxaltus]
MIILNIIDAMHGSEEYQFLKQERTVNHNPLVIVSALYEYQMK